MSAEGGGGGLWSRIINGAKLFLGMNSGEKPNTQYADDGSTLMDEMVINTKSRGDKVFNMKVSGRDRSIYENDKGIVAGGYRLLKQFRNWSDKMLSGGIHFEDNDNQAKGDQSLRKRSFGSRAKSLNVAGFMQLGSFAKGGEGFKYDLEDVKTSINTFNNVYSGLNNGNGCSCIKITSNIG